jgi:hypothetical protein
MKVSSVSSHFELRWIGIRHMVALRQDVYTKLLHFIESDKYFGIDRLYGLLSSTGKHVLIVLYTVLTDNLPRSF